MKSILKKFRLKDNISLFVDIPSKQFIELFKERIELEKGLYFKRKKYWGQIDNDTFKIRQKRKFFSFRTNTSNAIGITSRNNEKTKLEITLRSYNLLIQIETIGTLLVYAFVFIPLIANTNDVYFGIAILVIIALIWFTFRYILLRYDLKVFKKELIDIINSLN